jgi:hypothetical protein
VRTRTLLLLAVGCGLLILLAGAVLLVQLSGQDEVAGPLALGQTGRAGDAVVTVEDAVDDGSALTVTVRLGGVDDPAGLDGFRLIVAGTAVAPAADGTCTTLTVAEQRCTLVFATGSFDARSAVLVFRRAEQQVRWALTRG